LPRSGAAQDAQETPGQHAKQGARRTCAQIYKTSALRLRLFAAHRLYVRLERQLDVLRQAAPTFAGDVGRVSRNWSPAGLGLQPLLASWVWLAVQSTGCSKKRAAAVQGGDVRSGAERHDKLAARPLWNLSTHVAELETRACTGYALLPARGRAKSRRESSLLQPRRGRGL
jgi:hypothetical protein